MTYLHQGRQYIVYYLIFTELKESNNNNNNNNNNTELPLFFYDLLDQVPTFYAL